MNVYHGSNVIVNNPDVVHSFRPLDFGKGFYVTTVKDQAERWARRKMDICGTGKAIEQLLRYKTFYEVMRYE